MSASRELCHSSRDAIVEALGLTERTGDDGGPFRTYVSPMGPDPVGSTQVFDGVVTMVGVGLTVDAIGLDSHMLFAFTPADSGVPHFTLDSVLAGPHYAFHLDLIPRVDPGANLAYLDHCFVPLTEAHDSAAEIEGLERAHLSPRQWQLMSAWMLAHRADESAFGAIGDVVAQYRRHWEGLVRDGVPADALGGATAADLAARDEANRAAIFSPEVDPVWANVDRLIGDESSAEIREILRTAGRG